MLGYLANRALLMIPTLVGVAILIFFMLRVVPGDIVEVKLRGDGGSVTQETIEKERARLGLDPMQFRDREHGVRGGDRCSVLGSHGDLLGVVVVRPAARVRARLGRLLSHAHPARSTFVVALHDRRCGLLVAVRRCKKGRALR